MSLLRVLAHYSIHLLECGESTGQDIVLLMKGLEVMVLVLTELVLRIVSE